MNPQWKDTAFLVRLIENGDLDSGLEAIHVAARRRMDKLRADALVVPKQLPVTILPGDIVTVGPSASWRARGAVCKVMRVAEKSAFVRPLGTPHGTIKTLFTGYQQLVGFKVRLRDLTQNADPPERWKHLADKVPLPGEKLVIKRAKRIQNSGTILAAPATPGPEKRP